MLFKIAYCRRFYTILSRHVLWWHLADNHALNNSNLSWWGELTTGHEDVGYLTQHLYNQNIFHQLITLEVIIRFIIYLSDTEPKFKIFHVVFSLQRSVPIKTKIQINTKKIYDKKKLNSRIFLLNVILFRFRQKFKNATKIQSERVQIYLFKTCL